MSWTDNGIEQRCRGMYKRRLCHRVRRELSNPLQRVTLVRRHDFRWKELRRLPEIGASTTGWHGAPFRRCARTPARRESSRRPTGPRRYYTLANTALDLSLAPAELFDGEPPRHPPPTLTLAWLGVDRRFSGRGLGTKLFARALADAVQAFEAVRFVAVIVDALTDANVAFYERQGFTGVPGTVNKRFLAASTLVEIAKR